MGQRRLAIRNRSAGVGLLAVVAIGTVLLAPLATSSTPVGATTIDGAQSLADEVSVQFKASKGRTTDVHLLAWNDFHGNLEAGAGLNIYGQFAGGAAWLAKAAHDKQGSTATSRSARTRDSHLQFQKTSAGTSSRRSILLTVTSCRATSLREKFSRYASMDAALPVIIRSISI